MNSQSSLSSPCRPVRACSVRAAAGLAAAVLFGLAGTSAAAQTLAANVAAWQGSSNATRQGELRMGLTPNARLVYEPRPWQPATPLPSDYAVARQQASLGLEFKAPSKDNNIRSLLRVQLSGDSFVQFRPRSSGLAVTYKSQF